MEKRNSCTWCIKDPTMKLYHDIEWGVPLHDDQRIFEFLVLEGMQAGLSWLTILRKRDNFRRAFDGFDPEKVASYGTKALQRLLSDPGIIRNRLKIEGAIKNARRFIEVQEEFGSFDSYIWRFVNGKPVRNHFHSLAELPSRTPLSDEISRDLKQRGFTFVGSTIVYSHMQATGMVNDHIIECFRWAEI